MGQHKSCLPTSATQNTTYEHDRERWSLQRDEGRNPLHVLCSVVTSLASFVAGENQRAAGHEL